MRTVCGATATLLLVVGFALLPDPADLVDASVLVRVAAVLGPLLCMAGGVILFAWNFLREMGH